MAKEISEHKIEWKLSPTAALALADKKKLKFLKTNWKFEKKNASYSVTLINDSTSCRDADAVECSGITLDSLS